MKRFLLFSSTIAAFTCLPALASAQGWLADRSRAEGPGIRLGDFELHPGIGVEIGYDSNLFYTSDDSPAAIPRRDSAILRVTPHLLVSTVGEERRTEGEGQGGSPPVVAFRGGLQASYYEFFNAPEQRNVSIDASVRLTVLPERPFSFAIYDDFGRSIRPFTENTGASLFARIRNTGGVDLNFQTDGGVLAVRAGYAFGLDFFEDSNFAFGNSFDHRVSLQETFRFLPQTSLFHDTQFSYRDYYAGRSAATPLLNDSARLRTRLGLNGAITPEISLLAAAGYAAGFYDGRPGYDQDFDSFVAQAELRWRIAPDIGLSFGYDRDVFPSFVGNYYTQDRGHAEFQMLIGGAFLLGIDASVAYLDFGQIVDGAGGLVGETTERSDIRVAASIFAEYRFTDWLGINGTLSYTGDFTDFRYRVMFPTGLVLDPAGFNKFEAWLGLRAFL